MEKSTAAENVQAAYVPVESDFRLKNNAEEIGIDSNFAAQSFWKDVLLRKKNKRHCWSDSDHPHYHHGSHWSGYERLYIFRPELK